MPKQSISLVLKNSLRTAFNDTAIVKIGKALEKVILRIMWDRIGRGYDTHSRQWRRYKAQNYDKIKRKYGRDPKNSWLILTGDLKQDTFVKFENYKRGSKGITINLTAKVAQRSFKKAEGLMSTTGYDRNRKPYPKSDYKFLGLAESGAEVNKETAIIGKLIGAIGQTLNSKIKKKTTV